jgi:hypothetical protein
MGIKQYRLATEMWPWKHKYNVKMWLTENFGANGDQWGEQYDYGLENLWVDEDVYVAYLLRWA